ncbi:MAG: acyl-phosphate glycerol 3-phosphate acyltransferase [Candidatus Melainabacteria bacterium GWF2_37_15]|nr:MAG: acyl-phosphate glycerol 3-phosphate acyltransferase [Candidatus Melainabacteria bacterium GWF2_37_15]
MNYLILIGCVVVAYLIGSFPTGYILVKGSKGLDIREIGSGSTGATNVKRVMGTGWYVFVMLFDGLKGLFPVFASKLIDDQLLPVLVAVAVILGHSKSIFLNFTGGKSVASGIGAILGLSWPVGFLTIGIWVLMTYFTKIVSISSITVVLLTPIWMYVFKQPLSYIVFCIIGAVYIVYLHRDNIKRLFSGNENKIRQ